MELKLLTRDDFRESVFKRDGYTCVFCDEPAVDAHHIIERRLFPNGGYYIENGASVCEQHHLECEMTRISVEDVRLACGITKIVVPPHLYADQTYDKWGNPVLPNGKRLRGELFNDESVQKILDKGGVLDLFTHWVKYPRTYHLPWSPGVTKDDRVIEDTSIFHGKHVVVTEKMDGECTTMYSDYIHARSIDGRSHPSRDWVKQFHSTIAHEIPAGWRICGENLYAEHSISYENLRSYFYGFSIWNDQNVCLSWNETLDWFNILEIEPVPVLYHGPYDEQLIRALYSPNVWERCEGYVLRLTDSFHYNAFRFSVGKYVRRNHIQTTKHWLYGQPVKPNKLRHDY